MNATEITKIQAPPEQAGNVRKIELAAAKQGILYQLVRPQLRVKLAVGRIIHPFRIHTWVKWMQYDETSDRIIDTGGRICEFCNQARLA